MPVSRIPASLLAAALIGTLIAAASSVGFAATASAAEPIACTITNPTWTTEDTAPAEGAAGFTFAGPSGPAIDTYQRASGNMQGITGMTYTIAAGESGQPAQLVVEVDPDAVLNSGGPTVTYATISTNFPAGSSGVLDAQDALWSTTKIAASPSHPGSLEDPISWAAMIALMPDNTLLSAPSLHLLTGSTSSDVSTVTSVQSSCGTSSLVWPTVSFPAASSTAPTCTEGETYTLPAPPADTGYELLDGSLPTAGTYSLAAGQSAGPFVLATLADASVQPGSVTFGPFTGANPIPPQSTYPAGACYDPADALAITGVDASTTLALALFLLGAGAVAVLGARIRVLRGLR